MYIHFVSLHYIHPPTLAKKLNAALLFGSATQGQNALLLSKRSKQKPKFLKMEKETNIILRVSPSDKRIIQDKAKEAGTSVSEYARKVLLSGSIIKVDGEEKKTLNGIANNLNQLTRHANSTGIIPAEVSGTLKELIEKIRYAYRKR
eukprot:TRINITY_DN2587_c0_g1_i1.p1 TRINITY_DN2587_c0_g1~~TRINITY_DN2587_c0_g1_i1.p1  ORF type:complete len:147 (-),score=8.66 TRINITY_DN2587_c0_g1_i1:46-486(-)